MCVCELERNKNHELKTGYYTIDSAGWLRYYATFMGASELEKLTTKDSFIGVSSFDGEPTMYALFNEQYQDYESYDEKGIL